LIISSIILMLPVTTKWSHIGPCLPSQPFWSGLSKPKIAWTVEKRHDSDPHDAERGHVFLSAAQAAAVSPYVHHVARFLA
jgi:hypothetical protein